MLARLVLRLTAGTRRDETFELIDLVWRYAKIQFESDKIVCLPHRSYNADAFLATYYHAFIACDCNGCIEAASVYCTKLNTTGSDPP